MLELGLPFRIGAESVTDLRLALGLKREHFPGVIEHGSRGAFPRARPFRIGQRAEWRRLFPDADIARNHVGLLERHIKFGFVRKLDHEHLTSVSVAHLLKTEEPADAVFEVNYEIVLVQFAEVDLGAVRAEL